MSSGKYLFIRIICVIVAVVFFILLSRNPLITIADHVAQFFFGIVIIDAVILFFLLRKLR